MDPEERLFTAMSGGSPDRVPTLSLLADPNITNQVLGQKPLPVLKFLSSDFGSRYVDRRAAAISRYFNPAMFLFGQNVTRANWKLGFDGIWMGYWRFALRSHSELMDVFGRLFDIVDDGYGNPYMMYRDGLITSAEEWRRWPRPSIASYVSAGIRMYRFYRWYWRGRIAIVPFIGPGIFENSWQPMGLPRFLALMRKDEGFAREAIGYYTTLAVTAVDAYGRAGARVMGLGDDLAYKAGPMLSPAALDEFYSEGYRQVTAAAHRHGAKIFIHCCGNTNELVEKFVDWGFDGAHAFEPTAMNDLAKARETVGDRLCLIGNIDVTHVLVDGTRQEVDEAVRKAVADTGGGGFILAPTHTHGGLNVENVRWMIEAGRGS